MRKLIEIEFDDDFIPPETFENPETGEYIDHRCYGCPFLVWNAEYDEGACVLLDIDIDTNKCPIKKYFDNN